MPDMPKHQALTPATRLAISAAAYHVDLEDGVVILNLNQEQYYGLEEVGQRLWQLVSEGATLGEVHQRLLKEYAVEPDELWQDLCTLVEDLLAQGLVEIT
jgi:hypothetical protein